jgi:hypothetical protein
MICDCVKNRINELLESISNNDKYDDLFSEGAEFISSLETKNSGRFTTMRAVRLWAAVKIYRKIKKKIDSGKTS